MPFRYDPFDGSRYAASIGDLIDRSGAPMGRALASGLGSIGQALADVPVRQMQQRQMQQQAAAAQQQSKLTDLQIGDVERKAAHERATQKLGGAINDSTVLQDGHVTFDLDRFKAAADADPEIAPFANEPLMAMGQANQAYTAYRTGQFKTAQEALAQVYARAAISGGTADDVALIAAPFVNAKVFSADDVRPMLTRLASVPDPAARLKLLQGAAGVKPDLMTVNPGDVVVDKSNPNAGPVYSGPPKPPTVETHNMRIAGIGDKPVEFVKNPDGTTLWRYNGQDVSGKVTPIPPASVQIHNSMPNASGGGLDADGLELAAAAYRLTRTLPSKDSKQNAAILNEAAKQSKALGNSAAQTIQKQAAFKADASSLSKIQGMSSAAEAFETKAIAQADLVNTLSNKVDRTQFPLINKIVVGGKAALGDTDAHLFANALLTFTTEYAKIMAGSTGSAAGSTDSARTEAAQLISTALNKGTIDKTIEQMKWEMRQTVLGYGAVIGHITERMGGAPPAASGQTFEVGGFKVEVH